MVLLFHVNRNVGLKWKQILRVKEVWWKVTAGIIPKLNSSFTSKIKKDYLILCFHEKDYVFELQKTAA